MTEGELRLRGSEEPAALARPLTISGTEDTQGGVLSGLALDAAPVDYRTEALGQQVDVAATFTQVVPNSGVGQIDTSGNVLVEARLHADLHLEIGAPPFIITDCRTTPITLQLRSTAPYDPETGVVTLRDPNFTIPEIAPGGTCSETVRPSVNDLLAGGGHAITLTMSGDLVIPDSRPASTVALTSTTPSPSKVGEPITFDVAVTASPEAEPGTVPTGFVTLLDGGAVLSSLALDDQGKASFTTSDLAVGPHTIVASYGGDAVNGEGSSSPLERRVTAAPVIEIDGPTTLQVGGDPQEFTITVSNTGMGTSVDDARLDLFVAPGTANIMEVERLVGETWQPVTLTSTGEGALGTIGAPADLPAEGPARVERVRVRLLSDPALVQRSLTVELVPDAAGPPAVPPAPAAVARQAKLVTTLPVERVATTVQIDPSFPITPFVARPGYDVAVISSLTAADPLLTNLAHVRGTTDVLVNGRVVVQYQQFSPFGVVALPADLPPGPATVTVRYNGDALFKPSQASTTITLVDRLGPVYECAFDTLAASTAFFHIHVQGAAVVPRVATPGSVALPGLDLQMTYSREFAGATDVIDYLLYNGQGLEPGDDMPGGDALDGFGFTFGPGGEGTARSLSHNSTDMWEPEPDDVDAEIVFDGEHGTATVAGAPGEVVPITVESIWIEATASVASAPIDLMCTPMGEPLTLGEVTVAGTTLTVDAPVRPRSGDAVTLTAAVAPATATGVVEFLDGSQTLGVVPVDAGTATLTTSLPEGDRDLRARFFAFGVPSSTSDAVTVTVLPAHDCAPFAVEGNGAVVRLVYLELLRRCPDQVGFDHWVGRLDGGTSPEAFARSIATTPEAVGVVVDDGYRTMLGRPADGAGRAFWVDRMVRGPGRYDGLLADLAASDEFWTLAGRTDAGFVTRVYERLLGRAPERSGLDHWTGRLAAGSSRRSLVLTLANLDEPLGVLVAGSYDQILARGPFSAERTDGIAFLRATGDRSGLYAQLIGRPEFGRRAQDLPNPT